MTLLHQGGHSDPHHKPQHLLAASISLQTSNIPSILCLILSSTDSKNGMKVWQEKKKIHMFPIVLKKMKGRFNNNDLKKLGNIPPSPLPPPPQFVNNRVLLH